MIPLPVLSQPGLFKRVAQFFSSIDLRPDGYLAMNPTPSSIMIDPTHLIHPATPIDSNRLLLISRYPISHFSSYLIVINSKNKQVSPIPVLLQSVKRSHIDYEFNLFSNNGLEEQYPDADIKAEILSQIRRINFNRIAVFHVAIVDKDICEFLESVQ